MVIRPKRKFFSTHNAPLLGVLGIIAALIPIAIEPMLNSTKYSKLLLSKRTPSTCFIFIDKFSFLFPEEVQKKTRANIIQENVQPGSKYFTKCIGKR